MTLPPTRQLFVYLKRKRTSPRRPTEAITTGSTAAGEAREQWLWDQAIHHHPFFISFFFLFHKRIHQAGLARGHCLMQVISAGLQHGGAGSGLYSIFAHIVDLDGEKEMFMQRFTPFWEHRSSNAGVECSYLWTCAFFLWIILYSIGSLRFG